MTGSTAKRPNEIFIISTSFRSHFDFSFRNENNLAPEVAGLVQAGYNHVVQAPSQAG